MCGRRNFFGNPYRDMPVQLQASRWYLVCCWSFNYLNFVGVCFCMTEEFEMKRAMIEILIYLLTLAALYGVCCGLCRAYSGGFNEVWEEEGEM